VKTVPKNIILLSLDALRFDCVGYQKDKSFLQKYGLLKYINSTELDKYAAKGACFTQAVSVASYTTSAHASIFTGLYPPQHGIRDFFRTKLPSTVTTLAQKLKENGFKTFHSIDEKNLFSMTDLNRGVDHCFYSDDVPLFNALKGCKDEKIYLFAHFFDIHDPYLLSPYAYRNGYNDDFEIRRKELTDKYLAGQQTKDLSDLEFFKEIRNELLKQGKYFEEFAPDYVKGVTKFFSGRFKWFMENLESLGLLEDSLVVIFSDHGETRYGDHFAHAGTLEGDVIRIPLIFFGSNHITPTHVDAQVSVVDIAPTVMEIAGLKGHLNNDVKTPKGQSLLPLFSSKVERIPTSPAYSEFWACWDWKVTDEHIKAGRITGRVRNILYQRSYRTSRYLFILYGEELESFDLSAVYNLPEDEDFINAIFRRILYRYSTDEEMARWISSLKEGRLTRRALFKTILESDEAKSQPKKITVVDLQDNSVCNTNSEEWGLVLKRVRKIFKYISEKEAPAIEIGVSMDVMEDRAVIERLKNLGYME